MTKRNPIAPNWGTVALGYRPFYREPAFLSCWTAMLSRHIRPGDHVLGLREHILPAHWAADHLARSLLISPNDSLLMIDDDMIFPPDALERLRSNEANWPYDIVMGFCTTRAIPPLPVVMRRMDPQPGPPQTWKGEVFERVLSFDDGEVIPVDTVGLAFTLVRRQVFEAMMDTERDLDYQFFFNYGEGMETEDIPFCRRARQMGFTMAVDTGVKIRHIGKMALGYEQWASYQASVDGDRAEAEVS